MSFNSDCSRVLRLLTCTGGTGPMTGLTSSSVTIVICTRVTGHLTLVCLKTGKRNREKKKKLNITIIISVRREMKGGEGELSSSWLLKGFSCVAINFFLRQTISRKNGEKHQLQHQRWCVVVHISGWTFSSHFFLWYLLLDSSASAGEVTVLTDIYKTHFVNAWSSCRCKLGSRFEGYKVNYVKSHWGQVCELATLATLS